MRIAITLMLLVASVGAQTLNKSTATSPVTDIVGTCPVTNNSQVCIPTNDGTGAQWCFSVLGFDWNNGPPGEENYTDHTAGLGYNVQPNGTKIVPGLVSFTFSNEAKYRNGIAGQPGPFMSEHHFNWSSPFGLVNVRPLGWTVQYDTGNLDLQIYGSIRLFRHHSNGAAQRAIWYDTGALDMSMASEPRFTFPNNYPSVCWKNPQGDNTLCPLYVTNQGRTHLGVGGGGSDVYVQSNWMDVNNIQLGAIVQSRAMPSTKMQMSGHYTWFYSADSIVASFSQWENRFFRPVVTTAHVNASSYKVNGEQVLATPCAPIPDSNGLLSDDTRAINELLGCLRTHGLLRSQ